MTLRYTESGSSGPALLFLHGFLGSSEDWIPVTSALEGEYRCIVVDLPGHGRSVGLPEGDYTMSGVCGALVETLDALGVGRCVAVGYSMGGRVALSLALRHPERFSGLFVESASPGLKTGEERAARRRSDEARARELEGGDLRGFLERWHEQPLFASLAGHEGLIERLVKERLDNDPAELARSLRGTGTGVQPSLWDELPGLEVPTLAVSGELDGKFTRIAREMSTLSSRVQARTIAGAGHNVHLERPEEYARVLCSFLSATSRAG